MILHILLYYYVYIYIYIYTPNMYAYVYIYIYICLHITCVYDIYIYINMYTCMCIYIYTHYIIYIYIYIYTHNPGERGPPPAELGRLAPLQHGHGLSPQSVVAIVCQFEFHCFICFIVLLCLSVMSVCSSFIQLLSSVYVQSPYSRVDEHRVSCLGRSSRAPYRGASALWIKSRSTR